MLAPVTHVLPLTIIRRERLLPANGRVLVRKGQRVNTTDVVAEANLSPQHLMLDIARGLGIAVQEADKYIQRKAGEPVAEGDILAGPVGWTKRVVRAPQPGRIILVGRGKILLELESPRFQLRAGMPGIVTSLILERGVIIETTGSLTQGVWGNGGVDAGLMRVVISKPEDILTVDRLDVNLRGAIVLAGFCGDAQVLQNAAGLPLRGLILASMASSILPQASRIPFPIIVLEGFGLLPMNKATYNLLTTNDQREVALNAVAFDPYSKARPEVIIPLPARENLAEIREGAVFTRDQRVRIVRSPLHSQIGTILAVLPGLQVFASGIQARGAEIRLENGNNVILPLANLEVLE